MPIRVKQKRCLIVYLALLVVLGITLHFSKGFQNFPEETGRVSDILQNFTNQLRDLSREKASRLFDEVISTYTKTDVVRYLWHAFSSDPILLSDQIARSRTLQFCCSSIHTVGVYYPRIGFGGVERVISLQLQILSSLGYKIILFTDQISQEFEYSVSSDVTRVIIPKGYESNRGEQLSHYINKFQLNVMIYHAHLSDNLLFDLILTKSLGCSFIIYRHGSVLHYFNSTLWQTRRYYHIYRLADTVLVLSHMEEAFLKIMGVNCQYIPNPIQYPNMENDYTKNEGIILWIGRLTQFEKNYMGALQIMKLVVQSRPTAKLIMIGPPWDNDSAMVVKNFISNNHLEKNIEWLGEVKDVSVWYRKAKIHLLTSPYEGFPMVVVESKSFGVPLVMYSMPYVELFRNGLGYLSAPRDNISEAAKQIITLLDDELLCNKLSIEARESLIPFRLFNHKQAWSQMFKRLKTNVRKSHATLSDVAAEDARLLLESLLLESSMLRNAP